MTPLGELEDLADAHRKVGFAFYDLVTRLSAELNAEKQISKDALASANVLANEVDSLARQLALARGVAHLEEF